MSGDKTKTAIELWGEAQSRLAKVTIQLHAIGRAIRGGDKMVALESLNEAHQLVNAAATLFDNILLPEDVRKKRIIYAREDTA